MSSYKALLTVFSPDRVGLISEVTALLFDQGVNLGDTSFSILGKGGGFTSIIEVPDHLNEAELSDELKTLDSLKDADIDVKRFRLPDQQTPPRATTHQVRCEGPDQPGLLARLSEVFTEFEGNIVQLKSEQIELENGLIFIIELAVHIPSERAENCLAALNNTAEGLGQKLSAKKA